MKKTGWYRGDQKPVRAGVYERISWTGDYSFWNGTHWCSGCGDIDRAIYRSDLKSSEQRAPWRGIMKGTK